MSSFKANPSSHLLTFLPSFFKGHIFAAQEVKNGCSRDPHETGQDIPWFHPHAGIGDQEMHDSDADGQTADTNGNEKNITAGNGRCPPRAKGPDSIEQIIP